MAGTDKTKPMAAGVGPLVDGDEVTIEIENLGRLTNPVRRESPPDSRSSGGA